jgi:hypothetical protein
LLGGGHCDYTSGLKSPVAGPSQDLHDRT